MINLRYVHEHGKSAFFILLNVHEHETKTVTS